MTFPYRLLSVVLGTVATTLVGAAGAQDTTTFPTIGDVIRHESGLDVLLVEEATIEVLSGGFKWSEGPVWVPRDGGFLLFSDIPNNRVMKWVEGKGVSVFLEPAGYTGAADYGGEPGSNGLALDADGNLTLCEHGDRRIARMTWDGGKRTIVDHFQGKRFNSPNDLVWAPSGDLFFTDPPYGLPGQADSPLRELDFCGVYRVSKAGQLSLVDKTLTRPNGVGVSPDGKTLYVAQSDPDAAILRKYPINADGTIGGGKLYYDATPMVGTHRGLPDGLAIDIEGNVWATGPGGVLVLSSEGKLLGRIATGEATANCCFGGPDGSTLYITADMWLCRIQTKTRGMGF